MYEKLEERLEKLTAVISCKLATGEDKIDKVHILADDRREISEIIKDIKTVLLVEQELSFPEEKINIAQIETEEEDKENRIEIISIYKERTKPSCYIKLKINDKIVEEKITGQDTTVSNLVANGVLEIIEKYIEFTGQLKLDNVFIAGEKEDIIVVEVLLNKWGEGTKKFRLIGAAYINLNLPLASGKACLKALNRQLNIYL